MSSREEVLGRVRSALGRSGSAVSAPPALLREPSPVGTEQRIEAFRAALEKLAGKVHVASSPAEAGEFVQSVIGDRTAVIADAPSLRDCGLLPVSGDVSAADIGVTDAAYGLADTGSLVMLADQQPRLYSLLPPMHIAVLPVQRLLSGLDELLTSLPNPAEQTSSMVLITGPSRTADIEQILVRGVHGPGELQVVFY